MRKQQIFSIVAIVATILLNALPCQANTRERYYDVRDQFSSEQVVGPVTLYVIGINPFTDTVDKWDTVSKDIAPADPTSIFGALGAMSKAAAAIPDAMKPAAADATHTKVITKNPITSAQVRATNKLRAGIVFSGGEGNLAAALKAAPKHAATMIHDALLPMNSELRAVQDDPSTLLDLITKKPQLVAKVLTEAKPSLQPVTAMTQLAAPAPSAPPNGCPNPVAIPDLPRCIADLVQATKQLHEPLEQIRTSFQTLILEADAVLDAHRRITNKAQLLALRDDVRSCILRATDSCGVIGIASRVKVPITPVAVVEQIREGHDDFYNAEQAYNVLSIAVAGSTDKKSTAPVEAQLKILKALLDRYNSIFAKLDTYSEKHLAPMTVAGSAADNLLMAAGFEVQKIETCTGYGSHGDSKQDVLNYLPSPTTDMGDTNDDGTADTADNATDSKKPSAAPSPQTRHDDVTIVCEPPLFLSIGIAGDSLPGTSYGSAAANTAGLTKPAAGATAVPSTITSSGKGIGPSIAQLANYALTEDDSGGGLAISAGLGTNAAFNGKARADALLGLSYAFARTMVLTGGVSFGPTTQLAPGYRESGPILSGATVPTISSYRAGAFLGVTFVVSGSPKSTASPNPEPSKAPAPDK